MEKEPGFEEETEKIKFTKLKGLENHLVSFDLTDGSTSGMGVVKEVIEKPDGSTEITFHDREDVLDGKGVTTFDDRGYAEDFFRIKGVTEK